MKWKESLYSLEQGNKRADRENGGGRGKSVQGAEGLLYCTFLEHQCSFLNWQVGEFCQYDVLVGLFPMPIFLSKGNQSSR